MFFFFCLFEIMNECLAFRELVKPWLGWCVVFLPSECLSPSRSKDVGIRKTPNET